MICGSCDKAVTFHYTVPEKDVSVEYEEIVIETTNVLGSVGVVIETRFIGELTMTPYCIL